MWQGAGMGFPKLFTLLAASCAALIASALIALLVGAYVPRVIEGTAPTRPLPADRTYTMEDLDKAQRDMKALLKQGLAEDAKNTPRQVLTQIQVHAWWATWVPWFLLALALRIRRTIEGLVILTLPALLLAVGFSPPSQLLSFGAALVLGVALGHVWRRGPNTQRAT
jgi:hypothetical protein